MALKKITAPQGSIVSNGKNKAELTWNPDFAAKRNAQFSRKQMFVDSEVLRRCSPRVPLRTGMLEKSGKLGTDVGSGEVDYIAPYAAHQYYTTSDTRPYDANRGAHWFERMKVAEKEDILRGADKI
ncbi:MAG: Minor capsid protein [Bacteriophage sp.]|nr:MAG: Minor capsid protein [Bacteriophage sp.]UVY49706.1 MAG: Minor capsid protein [Bacteriophage sp.]